MEPPSCPPAYVLANAHFLLAGPVLGLVGGAMLRARGWRPLAWAVSAKALSTAMVLFPLSLVFTGLLPRLLGADPLGRMPWLGLGLGLLLLLASSLVEWPFFHRALVPRSGKASLALSLRANAVCLVLLLAIYLPFSRLTLLEAKPGAANVPGSDAGIEVFYLREGGLFRRTLEGPEVRMASGLAFGADARLFARRREDGWELWIQERDLAPRRVRTSLAPGTARAPQQPALHVKLKGSVRTGEPALPETFGRPAEGLPEEDSAWDVHLGQWPREGLEVKSRALGGGYGLALDTPLVSWEARCGTRLPGERLLFQMGPYLWLLELETRRLRLVAKGQGAQVLGSWK